MTVFFAGSMRETVSSRKFATQSPPSANEIVDAPSPTEIVRVIGSGPGSILHTTPSSGALAQTDPAPRARPERPFVPNSIVCPGLFVRVLIRVTETAVSPATHTPSLAAAIAPPALTGTVAMTSPVSALMRETVKFGLIAQRVPCATAS